MKIYCPYCSGISELKSVPLEGQNIVCPYCDEKFAYSISMSLSGSVNKLEGVSRTFSLNKKPLVTSRSNIEPSMGNKSTNNLIDCPDCGNKVSVRASSCPKCGAPIAGGGRDGIEEKFKQIDVGHKHWFVQVMNVLKYWVDAYKRIFDFSGTSGRMHLLSFIGVQFIIDTVLNYLISAFIVTSSWIIVPITILGTYAMFSLGLRRLNDIGISKKWAFVLGLIFVVGYVYDVINRDGISSPLFSSVCRIDNYLYVLLLCISWVKGGNCYNKNVSCNHLLPIVGLVVYVLFFFIARASLARSVNEFIRSVEKDIPFKNMTYNVFSRDGGSSTYIINTDAPANAQVLVVYVMGRLCSVQIIKCDNQDAADRVLKWIKKNLELEGEFLNKFR